MTGPVVETHQEESPTATAQAASRRWWSRWPEWSSYLAVAWSLLYGLASLYWALGGAGYPFRKTVNDRASASVLEPSSASVVAPVIAVFCAVGILVGVLMIRGWGTAWQRKALLAYGWLSACLLTFLIPDYSLLGLLAFSPLLLVFAFTGVPGHQTMGDILYWHRENLVIVFAGGLLWGAMTLAYQRRTGGQCVRCGRGSRAAAAWTEPAAALRWGRWAVWTAVISTLPYDITRLAWYFGWPLGITDAFLKNMQDTPRILGIGLGLGCASTLGSLLTHGLVSRWGEVWPRWVPLKRGKRIHPATAIVPASIVSVVLIPGGLMNIRDYDAAMPGTNGPGIFWMVWGAALGIATYSYYLRRRGGCRYCGQGQHLSTL
ncbi:NYN domain-containing protein [Kitasatospora sp. NPDC056531]|uniref:NYN domain-containing protein n=1 Tax=Kitasatospora sp. NPDC056531 TaxID=3345856 RepID=UPI0036CC2C8C